MLRRVYQLGALFATTVLAAGCSTSASAAPPAPGEELLPMLVIVLPAALGVAAGAWVLLTLIREINREHQRTGLSSKAGGLPLRGRWLQYPLAVLLAAFTVPLVYVLATALFAAVGAALLFRGFKG